jgi:hypothetical protein
MLTYYYYCRRFTEAVPAHHQITADDRDSIAHRDFLKDPDPLEPSSF